MCPILLSSTWPFQVFNIYICIYMQTISMHRCNYMVDTSPTHPNKRISCTRMAFDVPYIFVKHLAFPGIPRCLRTKREIHPPSRATHRIASPKRLGSEVGSFTVVRKSRRQYLCIVQSSAPETPREIKRRKQKSEAPEEGLEPSTTRLRALRSTD